MPSMSEISDPVLADMALAVVVIIINIIIIIIIGTVPIVTGIETRAGEGHGSVSWEIWGVD
jgi:hypothetical protein